jgi:hypothetical protein
MGMHRRFPEAAGSEHQAVVRQHQPRRDREAGEAAPTCFRLGCGDQVPGDAAAAMPGIHRQSPKIERVLPLLPEHGAGQPARHLGHRPTAGVYLGGHALRRLAQRRGRRIDPQRREGRTDQGRHRCGIRLGHRPDRHRCQGVLHEDRVLSLACRPHRLL